MSLENILETEGINSKGFGIFPKCLAIDTRISADAKAIYAYLTSYAGAGRTAFPGVDLMMVHLGMGRQRFYNARAILEAYGYITIKQRFKKDENGINRRAKNIYTLCANPKIVPELIEALENKKANKKANKKTKEIKVETPETVDIPQSSQQYDFETVGNETVGYETVGNDTINNNSLENNSLNINSSNKKNRKEKIKEKDTAHYFSDLPGKAPILPGEFIEDLDPFFVKRLLKDRNIYDLNFSENPLYSIFAEAVTKTQIQDNVEILTIRQYPYFIKTLQNMLDPYRKKINLLNFLEKDSEV